MSTPADAVCTLCGSAEVEGFLRDVRREYIRCSVCQLIFVPPLFYLSAEEEKAIYDLHENSLADEGYRRFLLRLLQPLTQLLEAGSRGLDFGSGPGPVLASLLQDAGYDVRLYDPYYAPVSNVFHDEYDFITATEVVEHLHQPGRELQRLWHCLRPGGTLGVMTKLVLDRAAFAKWHYKNDMTHVCFYSRPTFDWLAQQWRAKLQYVGNDVIMLTKTDCQDVRKDL